MRIIQVAATGGNISASDICEKMPDVPRTTIYRHIKILIEHGVLTVVAENKIRGSLERILSLNTAELAKHNSPENATQNAFGFLMQQYTKFERYFNSETPNPVVDRIFLTGVVLMLTDEEFDAFLNDLQQLLQKYSFECSKKRKTRDISIISAPHKN